MTTAEWTILRLLEWTTAHFTEHGVPGPRLDAELLLGDILKLRRIDLYLNFEKQVAPPDLARFKALIWRRVQREPLQYILGHADFFGRRFSVTPEVLIPRPETEQLARRALEWLDAHPAAAQVLDFGTGSGCIAITLALERPALHITAVDVSETALEVARGNAEALGADVDFVNTTLSPPPPGEGGFDFIISNPPYIPSKDIFTLQPEVSRFEPRLALGGGKDGLAFYRQLLSDAAGYPSAGQGTLRQLRPGGALALEIGTDQGDAILNIATTVGKWQTPQRYNDLSGVERIMIFELKD